jgi:ribosome-binding protein aMBF1 (putative translation factor)
MSRKSIPVEESFARWAKDPEFMREYDALEEEFALANALIGARAHAKLSQAELAERMGTSQSAIARLESGRSMPSTRTLERLAAATGTKLRIRLEPETTVGK